MTDYTPTPWKVEDNCLGVYPISAKQGPLTVQPAKAFGEVDAAFIVRAVNNHEALVEALKVARRWMPTIPNPDSYLECRDVALVETAIRNGVASSLTESKS